MLYAIFQGEDEREYQPIQANPVEEIPKVNNLKRTTLNFFFFCIIFWANAAISFFRSILQHEAGDEDASEGLPVQAEDTDQQAEEQFSEQRDTDQQAEEQFSQQRDRDMKEQQFQPRRSYQNHRGGRGGGVGTGRRGYYGGRGGGGGRSGGGSYQNGRHQYYDQPGNYYPRGYYNNRGRGGRGGGGHPYNHYNHGSSVQGGHGSIDVGVAS